LTKIETLIKEGNHEAAQEESIKLQHTSLDAIRYMQHYDWSYLMTVVILGYTGSIIYSLTFTIKTYCFQKKKKGSNLRKQFYSTSLYSFRFD
jgi:phosphatidylinositol glycan class N